MLSVASSLYRKYGVIGQKKVNVKYVVAKKSQGGGRPSGAKGPYKVVDKRLKKDKRAAKQRSKAGKKKPSSGGKGKGKGKGQKQQRPSKGSNKKSRT